MPDKEPARHDTVGAWTKRCYLAARAVMDDMLRPFDLGATQWYVMYHLAHEGPTRQRELQRVLHVERATLSSVVLALVRKQLIEQIPDHADQRQKLLGLTELGHALWHELPDLTRIHTMAFGDIDPHDIEIAIRVLQAAAERLEGQLRKEV